MHPTTELAPFVGRLVGLDAVEPPVVVACSGGPDSLALLILAAAVDLAPVAVYVDHGLRTESPHDARVVADAAEQLGVASRVVAARVEPGPNLEARARDERYDALERARIDVGASVILVGHTADDQAETVLLNLLRGSASRGLGGMAVRRDTVVRPLLRLRRAETEAVCAARGLTPRAMS